MIIEYGWSGFLSKIFAIAVLLVFLLDGVLLWRLDSYIRRIKSDLYRSKIDASKKEIIKLSLESKLNHPLSQKVRVLKRLLQGVGWIMFLFVMIGFVIAV